MTKATNYETRGGVAIVTFTNPPVNALGVKLRKGIVEGLERAQADNGISAIVLIGDGRCFSAGADIREFDKPPVAPSIGDVIACAESSAKPVIAAIHETAVGGGLELALGCHYRIGAPSAKLGSPEIKIGLIPGAGATQRLPRLIGLEQSLEIILTGDFLPVEPCLAMGLLDKLIEGDLRDGAVAFANDMIASKETLPVIRDMDAILAEESDDALAAARKRIERRARGLIAPYLCIESVENAYKLPFDEGLAQERKFSMRCVLSDQSAAQRHVFFAERAAMRIPGLAKDVKPRSIETAAVIGAGTMGGGIAMNFANAGIPVQVVEIDEEALERGLGVVRKNYAGSVSRGRLDQDDMDRALSHITGTAEIADAAEADIVIEAVFEDLDLKQQIFRSLDSVCKPNAILASNTSTLDIDAIAKVTKRPGSVVGTHFFSPANVMKLMENVRGAQTAPDVIVSVMQLARRLGKVPVLARVCDGFIGNRMLHAYTRQANFLLEEGALPQQVDRVIFEFGFPMGPFAMGDLAGLDIGWAIRKHRAKTRNPDERYSPVADRICELGRFGQKTSAGWYRYEEGSRAPVPDPEIDALIVGVSAELGIERRTFSDEEILNRCMLTLINEGARILEDGIAIRASDIDVTWIYGYGFPIYRGGPMYYADKIGLEAVCEGLRQLSVHDDEALKPAPLIERLAQEGGRFGELESA
jgi:3-hydroxyacyl-CoA dehydrogenase